jgi:hypothetical protein
MTMANAPLWGGTGRDIFLSRVRRNRNIFAKGLDSDPKQHRVRHRCRGQHQHQAVRCRSPAIPQAAIAAINSEISTL